MDGRVLILCDEKPGDYERYSVKDSRFLVCEMMDPADMPERLFVCWDSIIPEDRGFIEECKHYARFTEKPYPEFALSQRGTIDPKSGTIKTSIQEQCYLDTYYNNFNYLSKLSQKGEDVYGEAMDLAVQFPFDANQRFFEQFSKLLEMHGIITILPTFSIESDPNITNYRMQMLDAWKNANRFMSAAKKSAAKVVSPMIYTPLETEEVSTVDDEENELENDVKEKKHPNFGDVYVRAGEELMKIYSLPFFGENNGEQEGPEI